MADSQLILDLLFLHIRVGCSLTALFFLRILPLFRAVVKLCSTSRLLLHKSLFINIVKRIFVSSFHLKLFNPSFIMKCYRPLFMCNKNCKCNKSNYSVLHPSYFQNTMW